MKPNHGWVSMPILLMVIMLSALLVSHQSSLQEESLWQTQKAQQQPQIIWRDIYQMLSTMPAVAVGSLNCTGFCRPQSGYWQLRQFSSGAAWLQKQRIEHLNVERWCATRDQQRVRCWWQHDSGETKQMWLTY
ncbi:hypothetical protein [Marinomonas fungiae]|uniref:Uncharacterized protein n=1 Tax=Marinomonas fungiae TaxID=1137284 RepID=A0A0K6IHB8_9GAMM|nr:hypothetical protein [Marinomonas fungiae]CUB02456.1 hypothetical protein Ga0061065_101289 [Marinomonas fungiae]